MTAERPYWVFDLDDTLYAEQDYVRSALTYIGAYVERRFGEGRFAGLVLNMNAAGTRDPISIAWKEFGLPEAERASAILAMRAHSPDIELSPGAHLILTHLRQNKRPYAIVTDGRSITQRAKIAALGCKDSKFISISEEVGLSKQDTARFLAVEAAFPNGRFCYVGDNPRKDFVAPNQLGWKTIMLDHMNQGVHPQSLPEDPTYHPDKIVSDLRDLSPEL